MLELGILTESSRLHDEAVARALCMAVDGRIGNAHWIVGEALKDAVRGGKPSISLRLLSKNTEAFLTRKEWIGRSNPLAALL